LRSVTAVFAVDVIPQSSSADGGTDSEESLFIDIERRAKVDTKGFRTQSTEVKLVVLNLHVF
jgi:hypothetical protein